MVSTRGSTKKLERATRSSPAVGRAIEATKDAPKTPRSRDREPKKKSSSTAKARTRKQVVGQALRQKSTGFGLSISLNNNHTGSVNRKMVFNAENIDIEPNEAQAIEVEERPIHNATGIEDDDDDAVEEVQQDSAREHIQAEQVKERMSVAANRSVQAKRRKRKNKSVPIGRPDDEADDTSVMSSSFFAELDAQLGQDRKRKKNESTYETLKPIGKHTTFVVQGEEHVRPVQVNDNIQLIIWNEATREEVTEPKKPSEQSLMYSRSKLTDGKDKMSDKKRQQAKKSGRKTVETAGWTRSTKMNRLLLPGRRAMRKSGTGSAAPHLIIQTEL